MSEGIGICLICSELKKSTYECGCGWLENATHDPVVPVGFDPEVKEVHIEYRTEGGMKGRMIVRYCPSCGGAPDLAFGTLCRALKNDPNDPQLRARLDKLAVVSEVTEELAEIYEDEATASEVSGRSALAAE